MVTLGGELFYIAQPPLVVSKCALVDKQNAFLYTREPLVVIDYPVQRHIVKIVLKNTERMRSLFHRLKVF